MVRLVDDIHEAAENAGDMSVDIRARIRTDSTYAVRLCREAGEAMFLTSGGSGLAESNPV